MIETRQITGRVRESGHDGGAEQTRKREKGGQESKRKRKIYRRTAVNFVTAMWVERGRS